MTAGSYELVSDGAGETGLLIDPRSGFSLAVPGRPELRPGGGGGGEPVFEVAVAVAALGVTLRLRLDTLPFAAPKPPAMAAGLAQAYAQNRAAGEVKVSAPPPARLDLWGATGAASAIYTLRQPDAAGADVEELLVLVRLAPGNAATWALIVTKRFAGKTMAPLDWASFNSAVAGSLRWQPGAAVPAVPALFPASGWLLEGLPLRLAPARAARVPELAAALARRPPAERAELARKLLALGSGGEPPAENVEAHRATFRDYVDSVAGAPEVAALIGAGLSEVETAHDLRGWVLQLTRALG